MERRRIEECGRSIGWNTVQSQRSIAKRDLSARSRNGSVEAHVVCRRHQTLGAALWLANNTRPVERYLVAYVTVTTRLASWSPARPRHVKSRLMGNSSFRAHGYRGMKHKRPTRARRPSRSEYVCAAITTTLRQLLRARRALNSQRAKPKNFGGTATSASRRYPQKYPHENAVSMSVDAEKTRDPRRTRGRLRTSLDGFPRAGFQMSPKYLIRRDHSPADSRRTPADTPAVLVYKSGGVRCSLRYERSASGRLQTQSIYAGCLVRVV